KDKLDQLHRLRPFPPRSRGGIIHVQLACTCRRTLPLLDVYLPRHQHGLPSAAHTPVVSSALGSRVLICCLRDIDARRRANFLGGHASDPPPEIRSAWRPALTPRWRLVGSHGLASGGG